jgi:hypothetical protein
MPLVKRVVLTCERQHNDHLSSSLIFLSSTEHHFTFAIASISKSVLSVIIAKLKNVKSWKYFPLEKQYAVLNGEREY